jgi:hypothetical protein
MKSAGSQDDRVTTAQSRNRLGLLPLGPDPVHGRPLHRPGRRTIRRRTRNYTGNRFVVQCTGKRDAKTSATAHAKTVRHRTRGKPSRIVQGQNHHPCATSETHPSSAQQSPPRRGGLVGLFEFPVKLKPVDHSSVGQISIHLAHFAHTSSNKGVLRYRSPVEHMIVTITLPLFSGRAATSDAA